MTHPFHPLFDREFEHVSYRHNWGEDRLYYFDAEGRLRTIPACWTSVAPVDPFVAIAAGRSSRNVLLTPFRLGRWQKDNY